MGDGEQKVQVASEAEQGPPAGLDALIDEIANAWRRAARGARLALSGDYTVSKAFADWDDWLVSATRYTVRVADELWGRPAPDAPDTGVATTTMTVLPSVGKRPLRLRTDGLTSRAGTGRIGASDVNLEPEVVPVDSDTFKVHVSLRGVDTEPTQHFQGYIVDADTNEPVTDLLLVTNRDGGLVR